MYMTKRDVLELRRRMTKNQCTFSRLCGCYVNGEKNIVLKFADSYTNLDEDEFFRYLDIAKKVLSGSLGANILEPHFKRTEEATAQQHFLFDLKSGKLKDEAALDKFYDQVIQHYHYDGNYLILLFHDIYDVIARTKDRLKLDESSETYEYMICALCPVDFPQPGLDYKTDANCFGVADKNGVVGAPEIGFVYPAFVDRSADSNAFTYYVKTGKPSHAEFMEDVLQCDPQRTAAEDREVFKSVVADAFVGDEETAGQVFNQLQQNMNDMAQPDPDAPPDAPPVLLTRTAMSDMLTDLDITPEAKMHIEYGYTQNFPDAAPQVQLLVDKKLVATCEERSYTEGLEKQVSELRQQLAGQPAAPAPAAAEEDAPPFEEDGPAPTVELRTAAEAAGRVLTKLIDGQKCLVVPLNEGETARINGVDAQF